jgi:hypothetical protein
MCISLHHKSMKNNNFNKRKVYVYRPKKLRKVCFVAFCVVYSQAALILLTRSQPPPVLYSTKMSKHARRARLSLAFYVQCYARRDNILTWFLLFAEGSTPLSVARNDRRLKKWKRRTTKTRRSRLKSVTKNWAVSKKPVTLTYCPILPKKWTRDTWCTTLDAVAETLRY